MSATRTVLVAGSDTGVGKTRVTAALARLLAGDGARVQIVKVVETGVLAGALGDAEQAGILSGVTVETFTLASFREPLSPPAAARAEGKTVSFLDLVEAVRRLPVCDWRLLEAAGGIATPLDDDGRDWADFAAALAVDRIVVVVPDRLGAINQARLAHARAATSKRAAGIWLNEIGPVEAAVAASNRAGLAAVKLPLWAEQRFGAVEPLDSEKVRMDFATVRDTERESVGVGSRVGSWVERCAEELTEREATQRRRVLSVTRLESGVLNLVDNDYLALARDPVVVAAAMEAARVYGASASASPLLTGWREPHERLLAELCAWHRIPHGLIWTSGYAANCAVLGTLPRKGDVVLADRLIHHSMLAGVQRSGAQLRRYEHLRVDQLKELLGKVAAGTRVFVATESVFGMDGDAPDLRRIAALKRQYGFCWILDEAHAVGWHGPEGAGLAREQGVEAEVDVLVGTLGKALGSGGAYSLFRHADVRDYLVNFGGEFIYSTALSPINAAAATAAIGRVRVLSVEQAVWQERSRSFRAALRGQGWRVPEGVSPVVPITLSDEKAALVCAERLRAAGIWVAAVRPPTVPAGTSRLRVSLKRTVGEAEQARFLAALGRAEPEETL